MIAPAPKVAVVGCGRWGTNLVRAFHQLGALAAVNDNDVVAARRVEERFGVRHRPIEEILADSAIGAIVIATPAGNHALSARTALSAGKHVFVEKPLALDLDDAEELCRQANESQRVLMVGHLLRYHPAFAALESAVRDGFLGRLLYVYSNRLNFGRFRRQEDILWSFAPHDISMILSLVGSEPETVTATGASYLHPSIADVTTTFMGFGDGTRAHVFVSWLHPYKEQKLIAVGDRGMIVFDDGGPWEQKVRLYPHEVDWRGGVPHPSRAEGRAVPVEAEEPLLVECRHFLQCCAQGATPITDGQEGLRVLRVLTRAQSSIAGSTFPSSRDIGHADDVFVHETAYVDQPAQIGRGTRIWHFSHLLPGTRLGQNCVIGQNVMIGPDVSVGDGCRIQNNVSIFKGVTLDDDVFCGPAAVFTNVRHPRAEVDRGPEFERTNVGKGATIGANATIVCGVKLGSYSFVAAGAVVTADVAPFALVAGVPARRIGWVSRAGERLGADLVCPRTGYRYQEVGTDALEELPE